jgi:hypothetical protein
MQQMTPRPDKACARCGAVMRYVDHVHTWTRRRYCGNECAHAAVRDQGPQRFWIKVDKSAGETACWLYMGFRKWDGYGWLGRQVDGKRRYLTAHRMAWILTHGEPPAGAHILHQCDNPPCCNPAHLKLGTHQDNMADQRAKGRHVHGERTRRNKLTYEQVVEIRKRFVKFNLRRSNAAEIARDLGVTKELVNNAGTGRTWKSSTGPAAVL